MNVSEKAKKLALQIWYEQAMRGIGDSSVDPQAIDDWIINRTYPLSVLERAATGDVQALAQVRTEAGLPLLV